MAKKKAQLILPKDEPQITTKEAHAYRDLVREREYLVRTGLPEARFTLVQRRKRLIQVELAMKKLNPYPCLICKGDEIFFTTEKGQLVAKPCPACGGTGKQPFKRK